MPKIQKIRIVNLRYGKDATSYLMPDELIDINGGNAYIRMENGGGKTVSVQHLLNTLCSGITSSKRSRHQADYYEKPGYHAYVLIEWMKDNSEELLLTGHALSHNPEVKAEGGRKFKQYWFTTQYKDENDRYSIVNLELSSNENGKFVPASYDYIKDLAKVSHDRIKCFSENTEWTKYLSSYGIHSTDIKLMEQLNQNEDGINDAFEKNMKSSDALVNNLLIKAIQRNKEQINGNNGSKDSLESNLLDLLNKEYEKKDQKKALDEYIQFAAKLDELYMVAKEGEALTNKIRLSANEGFGFTTTIKNKLSDIAIEINATTAEIEQLSESIVRIENEEKSKEYHETADKIEEYKLQSEQIERDLQTLGKALDNINTKINIQKAASLYSEIKELESDIIATNKAITTIQNDEDKDQVLRNLKYSVWEKSKQELEELKIKLEENKAKLFSAKVELTNSEDAFNEAISAEKIAEKESHKATYELNAYKKETDEEINQLALTIQRNMIGEYVDEDILSEKKETLQASEAIDEKIKNNEKKVAEIKKINTQLHAKNIEYTEEKCFEKNNKKNTEEALQLYITSENKVIQIFNHFNIEYNFNKVSLQLDECNRELTRLIAEKESSLRNMGLLKEQLLAVTNNHVHISAEIIKYINKTGVNYQTCEQYLQSQIENNTMSEAQVSKLLDKVPALAYGIIISKEELLKLNEEIKFSKENTTGFWFKTAVPCLSLEEIASILSNNVEKDTSIKVLSACLKEYFIDKNAFKDNLEKDIENITVKLENITSQIEYLQDTSTILENFCKSYTKTSKEELEGKINKLNGHIKSLEETIENNVKTIKANSDEEEVLKKEYRKIQNERHIVLERITRIEKLIKRIEEEKKLQESVHITTKLLKKASTTRSNAEHNLKVSQVLLTELSDTQALLEKEKKEIFEIENNVRNISTEIPSNKEPEIINDNAKGLYIQYLELNKELCNEIAPLEARLKDLNSKKVQKNTELQEYRLLPQEYENILFSKGKIVSLNTEKENIITKIENNRNNQMIISNKRAEAEGSHKYVLKIMQEKDMLVLPKEQILGNFDERKKEAQKKRKELNKKEKELENNKNNLINISESVEFFLNDYTSYKFKIVPYVILQENLKEQAKEIQTKINTLSGSLDKIQKNLENLFLSYGGQAFNEEPILSKIRYIKKAFDSSGYSVLCEEIHSAIHLTDINIKRISTDRESLNRTKDIVIDHICNRASLILEGLHDIEEISRIKLDEKGTRQQILRLDLPKEYDEKIAKQNITDEVNYWISEFIKIKNNETIAPGNKDMVIKNKIRDKIDDANLVRIYLKKDTIPVEISVLESTYKNEHSRRAYRKWESVQKISGAQRFLSYFAVLIIVMNYNKSQGFVRNTNSSGFIILDNPFGTISNEDYVDKMFKILNSLQIQMVCYSHFKIDKIIKPFDTYIEYTYQKLPVSNIELVTHKENETLEHGYYTRSLL